MKKSLLLLYLFCFGRIAVWGQTTTGGNATAATTTPTAPVATVNPTSPATGGRDYDKTPITYNMTAGTFDKVLPFDRPFVFHFIGIPANVSYIKVIITKDNLKPFRKQAPGKYGPGDLDKYAVKDSSER